MLRIEQDLELTYSDEIQDLMSIQWVSDSHRVKGVFTITEESGISFVPFLIRLEMINFATQILKPELMKKILFLFLMAGVLFSCETAKEDTTDSTEPTEAAVEEKSAEEVAEEAVEEFPDPDAVGSFGDEISAEGAISGDEVVAQLAENDSLMVKVRGTISSCCQAKGCWMTMPLNDEQDMMIKFKDYAFFVPKNAGGKPAVVEGWAYREVVSVDELKHLASDNNATPEEIEAITEPEERITFMASGVIIEGEAESAE